MTEIGFSELATEAEARAKTDIAYEDANVFIRKYEELRGKPKIDIQKFAKKNWKTISAVAAAFGIPVGIASPEAFEGVFSILGNFWPF